ncbi:MAG: Carboxymuconolactone decarboxylase family protein [Methanomassiliicoccales archaeon PtaU1.Bin124]|nr:MAG: Carboxymuconolactone decarboxylase family protein [Methanomassiliicoccales archaeon PtaU1.Bin124]
MDPKTKEMVALSASVAGRCHPCFKHHLGKARELGISDEEIKAVVDLAKRISEVGNDRMFEFVNDVMKKEG